VEEALERALAAARPFPAVARHVERAVALARFRARDEPGGPVWRGGLSDGVPQEPERPLLPGDGPLIAALDEALAELVWAADCAEFTDATNNAAQYLCAAGHIELAARAALGPDGLATFPAVTVRDLATALDIRVEDLIADGERSLGSIPAAPRHSDVFLTYQWDVHHEAPVSSPDALTPRVLTSYSVRLADGRDLTWRPPVAPPADPDVVAERLRAGEDDLELRVSALALARALGAPDAYARSVGVHMSTWLVVLPDGVVGTLEAPPRGEPVPGVSLPAASARVLGEDDVIRRLHRQP
jgi:hypothetical protein